MTRVTPGYLQGYPYPYPGKPVPVSVGMGFTWVWVKGYVGLTGRKNPWVALAGVLGVRVDHNFLKHN
jgi:hypothetical protein